MSRPKSIYVVPMSSVFHFHLYFPYDSYNLMKTDKLVLLFVFENMSYYFWMITRMKNVINSQIDKVHPYRVAWHLLESLSISVWRYL